MQGHYIPIEALPPPLPRRNNVHDHRGFAKPELFTVSQLNRNLARSKLTVVMNHKLYYRVSMSQIHRCLIAIIQLSLSLLLTLICQ